MRVTGGRCSYLLPSTSFLFGNQLISSVVGIITGLTSGMCTLYQQPDSIMLSYYRPLAIVLLLLEALSSSGQDLTTCHTRPQDPFSEPSTDKSTGATFYIDLNNPFTCHGVIKQWRFCYRRSPGALFDTIYFGVYAPNSDGDTYIKKGSNSIYIGSLKNQECLYRDANPQLVVQQGYYIAWYASLIFIEYFDDPVNGHLYRSVGFPNSISHGVLIKTPDIRAPKIHALLQNLDPVITSTSTTLTSTSTAVVQPSIVVSPSVSTGAKTQSAVTTAFPSPTQTPTTPVNSSLGIPPPDLNPRQCNFGVEELFATSFLKIEGLYVNDVHISICSGVVKEIVFCYRFVEKTSFISIGIWRSIGPDDFMAVEEFELTIEPEGVHHNDPLMCTAVLVNSTQSVAPGDQIGFQSSDIEMAFGDETFTENNDKAIVPLLRLIIGTSIF